MSQTESYPELTAAEWFRRIMLEWELSEQQLAALLGVDQTLLSRELKKSREDALEGPTVPSGMDTAPAVIRMYQLLVAAHPKVEDQVKWLFSANQDFGGEKPIDVAASSRENLFWIAYYLDGAHAANAAKKNRADES